MKYHRTRQLKNNPRYLIHVSGFVIKVMPGKIKDIVLENYVDKDTKTVYVDIDGERKNLLYLMLEYFAPDFKFNQKLEFKVKLDNNRIPLACIKIQDVYADVPLNTLKIINEYNCKQRAESSNYRGTHVITPVQVAECLITFNFQCVYCNEFLHLKNWHLDHYTPLSKGGKNAFENLVPSCSVCNIMKGAVLPDAFYKKCQAITENFLFKKENEKKLEFRKEKYKKLSNSDVAAEYYTQGNFPVFELMEKEHGISLTKTQVHEIVECIILMQKYTKESNGEITNTINNLTQVA